MKPADDTQGRYGYGRRGGCRSGTWLKKCDMKMEPVRFTSIMEESTNKLWGAHFGVPPLAAASLLNEGEARRVVCRLNDVVEYQCAMLPRGDGTFVISVNKKLREKLGLQTGSSVQVSLHKDESEYGLPMPEELAELIAQDPEAGSLLHALTPGKLRTLLYIVGQPKNPNIENKYFISSPLPL